ncbi:MAG: hypothetical protein J1F01_01245 [Oscillospiraceae bacterium]|nr:hypothetical protein [Oscillospiraceae bacterium]
MLYKYIHQDDIQQNDNGMIVVNIKNTEVIYNKGKYYDLDFSKNRVYLTGKITASSDTDESVREKEVKFVVGEDKMSKISHAGMYRTGEELTLLMRYDDIKNYVGKDCSVYCEMLGGNLTVIMAE